MTYDVIVIGVGAMGAATCWELARRGKRVLGLEQCDIPHTRGSSHGFSRMIRMAYYEHPDYVPLLRRAFERWYQLEADSGQKLFYEIGGLYMGREDGDIVGGSLRAAREHGLPHDLFDRDALRRRYPQFELPAEYVGIFEKRAGFLLPERAIAVFVIEALKHGAEIHGHEPVVEWRTDDRGARVRTERGTYHAEQLVFCGGAWSDRLIRDLGVPLQVTRQVLGWVWPKQPELFSLETLPAWAIERPAGGIWYGFPMMPDSPGFKIAAHHPGHPFDPSRHDRPVSREDEATFRDCLHAHIPTANGPLLSMRMCMYTNSPDQHFILDRLPNRPRVTVACGFSGHGFKFASVVGEVLADLAMEGATRLPAQFLGLGRIA